MRLFESYLNEIDEVFAKKVNVAPSLLKERRNFSNSLNKAAESLSLNELTSELPTEIEGPKVLFKYDENYLQQYFGTNVDAFDNISIGAHPDFMDLDDSSYLNHHCVSVFVDIKGSTRLIEKYSLLEVRLVKDSLLTLAIHVANQFGGHVQRLQGDGIFLQFVRRDRKQNDAIINALNATSILAQFVSVGLAEMMEKYDLRPIKIRIGIDFGKSEDVLWSYYGIPNCGELTTTSLHTDMAAKLQSKAYDNSILIGGNVKEVLDLKNDFYSIFENRDSKEKVYYISRQFTYPFYVFNWKVYLLSLPFVWKTSDGKTLEIREKSINIECIISDADNSNIERYYPNSKSIPKGKKIKYNLKRGQSNYIKLDFERIEWLAFNSGKEAEDIGHSRHDFDKLYHDKNFCETSASYLGHHYVECRLIKQHGNNERITFPIFVQ